MHRRRIDGHVHLIPKREPGWIDPITQYRHDAYGMLRTPLGDRRRLPPYMADSAFEAGSDGGVRRGKGRTDGKT